jgi:hypothetical protein
MKIQIQLIRNYLNVMKQCYTLMVINIRNKIGLISNLLIKSKYRKSENVIILNEVPDDVMINGNTAYLEICI